MLYCRRIDESGRSMGKQWRKTYFAGEGLALAAATAGAAGLSFRLLTIMTSTRRFRARPWGVSLVSTGKVSARPTTEKRSRFRPKASQNASITAMARAHDNSQLLLKRRLWIGIESVCPST